MHCLTRNLIAAALALPFLAHATQPTGAQAPAPFVAPQLAPQAAPASVPTSAPIPSPTSTLEPAPVATLTAAPSASTPACIPVKAETPETRPGFLQGLAISQEAFHAATSGDGGASLTRQLDQTFVVLLPTRETPEALGCFLVSTASVSLAHPLKQSAAQPVLKCDGKRGSRGTGLMSMTEMAQWFSGNKGAAFTSLELQPLPRSVLGTMSKQIVATPFTLHYSLPK